MLQTHFWRWPAQLSPRRRRDHAIPLLPNGANVPILTLASVRHSATSLSVVKTDHRATLAAVGIHHHSVIEGERACSS